ncbi:MAG: hypothetical protein ACR2FX_08355, partial [Chthoniobacterales bacterium]
MNPSTEDVATSPQPRAAGTKPAHRPATDPTPENRRAWAAPIIAAAALVIGFGFWLLSREITPGLTAHTSAESAYVASFPEKSIAVLPFEDSSENKEQISLADGVQDDTVTALSKVADLRVISRTSASTYAAGKPRSIREIAQSLGVAYVLEGSVRHNDNNKVSIVAQLTDARRDTKLWSQRYERDVSDVFGVQSDLVQRVASSMQATVSAKEAHAIEERPTNDVVAYDLYVRGKTLIASVSFNAQINDKLLQSTQLLDQAIVRDPNFYLAYCQLAAAHNYIYFFGFDHTPARLALAESALKTVERLRPEAGETHLAKATYLYR